MYKSLHAKNFRCFSNLTFGPLARVNLIAGKNNVGKTALLEALFLHIGANNPPLGLRVNIWRGIEQYEIAIEEIWGPLFGQMLTNKVIELVSIDDQDCKRSLTIKMTESLTTKLPAPKGNGHKGLPKSLDTLTTTAPSPELLLEYRDSTGQKGTSRAYILEEEMKKTIKIYSAQLRDLPPGVFISTARSISPHEDSARFSKLQTTGRDGEIVEILKLIEPRLSRLVITISGGVPIVSGDIGIGRLVPLPLMGQGMGRLFSFVLAIVNSKNGFVLIDEIENGLHYSVMPEVWKAIGDASRRSQAQIFATTHSFTCIHAAHEAFSESDIYDFRLHRLERVGDDIRSVSYDQETLSAAIATDLEVR